jgi:hypothetical protein
MDQNEQTQSAFSPSNRRDAYLKARAETPEQKGLSYSDLFFDNIYGLDNEYESTGETLKKALREDTYGTLGNMATGLAQGIVDFVRNPYEGVKGIVEDTAGSIKRVATEDLDEKLNRMYGVSYEEATPDQVTKAREVVASDVMTVAGVIPAVKGVGLVAKGAVDAFPEAAQTARKFIADESGSLPLPLGANQTREALGEVPTKKQTSRFFEGKFEKPVRGYTVPEEQLIKYENFEKSPSSSVFADMESSFARDSIIPFSNLGDIPVSTIREMADKSYSSPEVLEEIKKDYGVTFDTEGLKSRGYENENTALRHYLDLFEIAKPVEDYQQFLNKNKIYGGKFDRKRFEKTFNITYRNPVVDVVDEITFPKNGLKGSEFIKFLDKSPSTKAAQYNTVDLGIDKNKSYSKEELLTTIEPNTWETKIEVLALPKHEGVQVRDYEEYDPTKREYKELLLRVNRKNSDLPTFTLSEESKKKFGQYHFPDDVVAHTRIGTEENIKTGGKEVVVYEFQSDYLQKGASRATPAKDADAVKKEALSRILTKDLEDGPTDDLSEVSKNAITNIFETYAKTPYVDYEVRQDFKNLLRSEGVDIHRINNIIYELEGVSDEVNKKQNKGTTKLPIGDVKDSVENLLDGVLGYAQDSNVDKVFIPSIEQLAAERYAPGSLAFFEAVNPGSNFYNTYVIGLEKATADLAKQTGAVVSKETRNTTPMASNKKKSKEYTGLPENIAQSFLKDMQTAQLLGNYYKDKITFEKFLSQSGLTKDQYEDFISVYRREINYANKDKDDWYKIFKEHAYRDAINTYGETFPVDTPGTAIDISEAKTRFDFTKPRYAEGGMVEDEQMNRLMQEGGMADDGMSREPVTGNNIPPGALASEVRDNVDAKLSGGEYVVPADVLRYYGVRFFEDLRAQAKQGMMEMESEGRIGGVPVDDSGVPVEGQDEELTPEEEQMLAQAMSLPSGMAEGGVAFDRTEFTIPNYGSTGVGSPVEERLYFNPTTGEKTNISFMSGTAMGSIPAGFVPWTQFLQDTYDANKGATKPKSSRKSRDDNKRDTTPSAAYSSWADQNYNAITSNPFEFGMNALQPQEEADSKGLAGGLIGILTGKDKDIQNIANANAALKIMESKGLTGSENYKILTEKVKAYVAQISPLEQGLVLSKVAGTGNAYMRAIEEKAKQTPAAAPAASPVTTTPAAAPAAKSFGGQSADERREGTGTRGGGGVSSVGGSSNKDRIVTPARPSLGGGVDGPRPTPKPTPKPSLGGGVDGPRPTPKPVTGRPGSERFAEGGLVVKPKKTNPKSKGLGGKQ